MPAVNLIKGGRAELNKNGANSEALKKIAIELGWTTQTIKGMKDFDLDASVIPLETVNNKQKLAKGDTDNFIFYGHQKNSNGSIQSMGDNLVGDAEGGVCEVINVDFEKLAPLGITELLVVVTIYDAENRQQNFGQVASSFIQIKDPSTGKIIIKAEPSEDFSGFSALLMARIYLRDGKWMIQQLSKGFPGSEDIGLPSGLLGICNKYDIPT